MFGFWLSSIRSIEIQLFSSISHVSSRICLPRAYCFCVLAWSPQCGTGIVFLACSRLFIGLWMIRFEICLCRTRSRTMHEEESRVPIGLSINYGPRSDLHLRNRLFVWAHGLARRGWEMGVRCTRECTPDHIVISHATLFQNLSLSLRTRAGFTMRTHFRLHRQQQTIGPRDFSENIKHLFIKPLKPILNESVAVKCNNYHL